MDKLEVLRAALAAQAELCRMGHWDPFPAFTLGDVWWDRKFWLRDLVRSVAAEADRLGLDPAPLLSLLQPIAGPEIKSAVGAALAFVERVAIRREQPKGPATVTTPAATPEDQDLDDEPITPAKLADRLGIPQDDERVRDTLNKRLQRWRVDNPRGGWVEVTDPKPRQPRYLYPLRTVLPIVEDLKPSG